VEKCGVGPTIANGDADDHVFWACHRYLNLRDWLD
jgi:hypothetical protein